MRDMRSHPKNRLDVDSRSGSSHTFTSISTLHLHIVFNWPGQCPLVHNYSQVQTVGGKERYLLMLIMLDILLIDICL